MSQHDPEYLKSLTIAVLNHLEEWKVNDHEIINLLGLEGKIKTRQLASMRKGDRTLPSDDQVMLRVEHIIGIADALRTSFPFSREMRSMWLYKAHRRFQRKPPLAVMLAEGLDGLLKVRIEVDCAYGYAISDAMYEQQQAASA